MQMRMCAKNVSKKNIWIGTSFTIPSSWSSKIISFYIFPIYLNKISLKAGLNGDEVIKAADDEPEYKIILRWRNILAFIYLHIFTVVALFFPPEQTSTYVYQFFLAVFIG